MVHVGPPDEDDDDADDADQEVSIRQVEFNTIASSFGGLSAKVSDLHRHLQKKEAWPESSKELLKTNAMPGNLAIPQLQAGLLAAHQAYGRPVEARQTCMLFITQPNERNVFDQKHLEYEMMSAKIGRAHV